MSSTRSRITNGVRPGTTSSRRTNDSSMNTRPSIATAAALWLSHEYRILSFLTAPVWLSTFSGPKNLMRAFNRAASGAAMPAALALSSPAPSMV